MRLSALVLCFALPTIATAGVDLVGSHPVAASSELSAAASPIRAVQVTVRGYYDPRYNMFTCSTRLPMHRLVAYATCPVTSRLRRLLNHPPYRAGGLPFSRSQTGPRTVRVSQRSRNGQTAFIDAWWDFGPRSFTTTFVVKHQSGGWLIDDEYCAGRPSTSIYRGHQPCR